MKVVLRTLNGLEVTFTGDDDVETVFYAKSVAALMASLGVECDSEVQGDDGTVLPKDELLDQHIEHESGFQGPAPYGTDY